MEMIITNSNFDFLKSEFPVLFQFGKSAEAYLYSDSNSCLMKLGMIGETIVNLMFTYDHIQIPIDNTAVKRIDVLYNEGLLTQDLVDILHALRKTRNKAVHENYESVSDGKALRSHLDPGGVQRTWSGSTEHSNTTFHLGIME